MTPPSPDSPGIFRCPGPDSLSSVMEKVLIKDIAVEELSGEMVFDSAEDYWTFMVEVAAPITGALSKVDEKTCEEVRQKTLSTLETSFMSSGKVVLPWVARVATGTKQAG